MSYTWATAWRGVDDEPGPRHDLRCRVMVVAEGPVPDPEADCTCRATDGHTSFTAGVERLINLIESYGPPREAGS